MSESNNLTAVLYYLQQHYPVFCVLNSNNYQDQYSQYDVLIGVGNQQYCTSWEDFQQLEEQNTKQWKFGFLGYDLKNKLEELSSTNSDLLQFPELFFFIPETVLACKGEELVMLYSSKANNTILEEIKAYPVSTSLATGELRLQQRLSKEAYLEKIAAIHRHIQRGDVYELNFCMEFFAEAAVIDPIETYLRLNQLSPTPFSGLLRFADRSIICASPERYLQKQATTLLSQPIKGTAARNANRTVDEQNKQNLRNSSKEQSENVMIVDLVRNDLSRIAERGSVKVDELCGIYSFPQWHQMISTISCKIKPEMPLKTIISHTFPMGSMTGAPKIAAMQLIEKHELSKRGAYSGALGYITPENDFDFNVIIRSILYDATAEILSFHVGSAITAEAIAEDEYDECLLKAKAMIRVLNRL